ncbi:MAG: amino acid adenylation domain-containing protein [Catenulispora sp.]|nr:amino acid adenylation domain-containing protein [Catenulispora sp.]
MELERHPATFAQQRLWLLQEVDPEATAYHVTEIFTVQGPLDLEVLARAVCELCVRHEALRTRFEQVGEAILQLVPSPDDERGHPGFEVVRIDPNDAAAVVEFRRAALAKPFDLRTGPLLRVYVAELGADRYEVLITAHHSVCDGWSMGLLLGELSILYRSFLRDEPAELAEPELQYSDYAAWEREWLDETQVEECLRYWNAHLAGAPTVLTLPADRPRRAAAFSAGDVYEFPVSEELTARLEELARSTRSSLSIVLLAVYHVLLARLSGERDVLVGYPISGRTQAGSESLIGMLVNTLPLRGDMRDDPTFHEFLLRVRASVLEGQEYGELPFERIVEDVNPDRTLGVLPLIQVMFQYLDDGFGASLELEGATVVRVQEAQPTTDLDLALDVFGEGDALRASFNYNKDLFDRETVARFADRFLTLLAAATENPDTRVSALPVLSTAEESAIKLLGHGNSAPVPAGGTVLTALWEQIAARPQDIAIEDAHRRFTYQELGEAVEAVAAELVARGVGRGDCVALMATRSALLPVGVFGILRAGAVLVPMDPANPFERLHAMADEASVRAVLADDVTRPAAERLGPPLVDLATAAAQRIRLADTLALPRSQDPAYVIFTSGSTGTPKGVVVQHGALANLYHSHRSLHYRAMAPNGPHDRLRVALTMSIAFDASWDQLLWMVDGNLLYVFDDETSRDAHLLLAGVRAQRIDVLEATPSFAEHLVGLGLLDGSGPAPTRFVLGGEAMRPSLWSRFAAMPETKVLNLYGPTEFTVDALGAMVSADSGPVIGRPMANCAVTVLDEAGGLVPLGVVGEICLSGPQLALGYLNDPAKTAKAFRPDPHSSTPGARMYRTGDLGRLRGDGVVEFVGRVDGQVKIRGYRIDLGEVESALLTHPEVEDAAVVARPDGQGNLRLVGYVVAGATSRNAGPSPAAQVDGESATGLSDAALLTALSVAWSSDVAPPTAGLLAAEPLTAERPASGPLAAAALHAAEPQAAELPAAESPAAAGPFAAEPLSAGSPAAAPPTASASASVSSLSDATLRAYLAERLPEYMLPAAIVHVPQIPRNVSGKVAASDLPEPDVAALRSGEFVAPAGEVEAELAEIFADVLGIDAGSVSRFDDFFRLGGHSLSAVQLISRIRERLGGVLSLRSLFEHPTVAGLGADLGERTARDRPIPLLAPGAPALASSAQQRLWVAQLMAPDDTGYNMVEAVRLRGALEVPLLAAALRLLINRHDVLRSTYGLDDNHLVQSVSPAWGRDVTRLDLSALPAEQAWQHAEDFVQDVGSRDYDLATGPLCEAAVLTLGAEDHLLVFGAHHIVCDGWSVKVLLSEVAAHYRDLLAGRTPQTPAPAIQFQDYAAWERGAEYETALAEHIAYWRAHLAGAPAELPLPGMRERPPVRTGRGATVRFTVPADVTADLTALARERGTTLFTALLAGFDVLLARVSGRRDLLVGVPVAGRIRSELEDLVGLFVNILPMRADLGGELSFGGLLDQIRDTALSAYAHQALSFERMVELANPDRELSANPLVQVTCQLFEESGAEVFQVDGVTAESVQLDIPSSRFDLSLDLMRQGDALSGELIYDTDLFEPDAMARLARDYCELLREVTMEPHRPMTTAPDESARIESALAAHPQILAAAVTAGQDDEGRPALVAHLVPEERINADDFADFMESWRFVFETTYVPEAADDDEDAALQGWVDSFTQANIPPADMREWVEATVGRVLALTPDRLLEVGAGTGLLVRPLCERAEPAAYVATDYADSAMEPLGRAAAQLAQAGVATSVAIHQAEAIDAPTAVPGTYDTIVLNSVAQYFPSLAYLQRFLDQAVSVLAPGGHIFLGDLRNSALLEAFISLREQRRHGDGAERDEVVAAIARALRTDSELSIDPLFFSELLDQDDRISAIEIAPRRGTAVNEMSLFRYDVIVHAGCAAEHDETWWEADPPANLADIERRLSAETVPFGYRRLANARLTEALALRDGYGFGSGAERAAAGTTAFDPEALWRLGARHGWSTRISWGHGDADGTLDVTFLPADRPTHYTLSTPLTATGRRARTPFGTGTPTRVLAPQLERALTASLEESLHASGLPAELIPSRFVYHLGPLPETVSGRR